MGSYASLDSGNGPFDDSDDDGPRLGDLLSGRLADVEIDSVDAVRDERERQ